MSSYLPKRFASIVLLCAGLAACSQGDREICQIDSDCDDGFVCKASAGLRGRCEPPEQDAGANDANIEFDASFDDDAGFDMDGPTAVDEDAG
jgi:hypothetical protein